MRIASGLLILLLSATAAQATTSCTMTFELKGWSAFYKVSHGSGKIKCDNGQRASVELEAKVTLRPRGGLRMRVARR